MFPYVHHVRIPAYPDAHTELTRTVGGIRRASSSRVLRASSARAYACTSHRAHACERIELIECTRDREDIECSTSSARARAQRSAAHTARPALGHGRTLAIVREEHTRYFEMM